MTTRHLPVIVCVIADTSYAVPAQEILEVTELQEITPVPDSNDYLLGLCYHHGQPIPVLELSLLLGYDKHDESETDRLIVVEGGDGAAALRVGYVREFLEIPLDSLRDPPELSGGRSSLVERVSNFDSRILLLLSPQKIFDKALGGDR